MTGSNWSIKAMTGKLGRWGDWYTAVIVALAVGALIFFLSQKDARADEPVFSTAIGSTVMRGETPAVGVHVVYPNAGPGDADYEVGLVLVGDSTDRKGAYQPNQAGVELLLVDGYGKFDLGLGIVALQNVDSYNGSRGNFSLLARWNFNDNWYIEYSHWSNAGTVKPNLGRDMLRVGYKFR